MMRQARHPRLPSWVAVLLLAGSLSACGANRAKRPDPAPSAVAADAGLDAGPDCDVRRAARTFVGFSENMSLADFELAAFEAERIVGAIRAQLCAAADAGQFDASLSEALRAGALEITSIVFTRDDAGAADARVRLAAHDGADAGPAPSWLLHLVRDTGGWHVVSAAAD